MDTSKTYGSFVGAMADYFGKAPGQTLGEFGAELKALSDKDRAEFRAMLEGVGYKFSA